MDTPSERREQAYAPPVTSGGDCATAVECRREWSRAGATSAGYDLVGFTGSAWVAEGRGRSFFIWATSAVPTARLRAKRYRIPGRVDGILIHGYGIRLDRGRTAGERPGRGSCAPREREHDRANSLATSSKRKAAKRHAGTRCRPALAITCAVERAAFATIVAVGGCGPEVTNTLPSIT